MTAKNGEATSSVLVKSLVLASLVVVSVFVAVPLGLLAVADGWLTFYVGDWRFAGLAPIVVGTGLRFGRWCISRWSGRVRLRLLIRRKGL
jgi:hypothetical protein